MCSFVMDGYGAHDSLEFFRVFIFIYGEIKTILKQEKNEERNKNVRPSSM